MIANEKKKTDTRDILVVDDTPANLLLLTRILTDHGYHVRPASDGALALQSVAAKAPDLILLDVKMPDMDGLEVCRRLKSDAHSREIPVLFISALGENAEKVEGFRAGGLDYIVKPFNPEEVLARVGTHLRLSELVKRLEQTVGKLRDANAELSSEIKRRKRAEEALRAANEDLEIRVAQRTAELKHANEQVQHELVEHMRAEEEKIQLEKKLLQSHKMEAIGALAGGIAHDFNNILYPIIGMSEMLLEDLPAGSPEYENMEIIFKAGWRAGDLVKQILSFSRQSEHQKIPVRIQHVLKEVLKLTRSTIPSDIEISQSIQADCGLIMADPTQLHQIAMNLITNAYHAVEASGGRISIELKQSFLTGKEWMGSSLEPGEYARIIVSDTGCGIDPAVMGKIFEPYFTTKGAGKGTGLGLSVVHGIALELGGDIRVYSEPGKGSTFNVYLPLLQKDFKAASDGSKIIYEFGTERILLIDDEEPIVRLEQMMLEKLGYHVTARTSSIDALALFKTNPDDFDLVITDMTMPNITGDKLARELTAIKPGIPVIICTGFSTKIDEKSAKAMGADGFLLKPIVKSDMARMVRKMLDESQL